MPSSSVTYPSCANFRIEIDGKDVTDRIRAFELTRERRDYGFRYAAQFQYWQTRPAVDLYQKECRIIQSETVLRLEVISIDSSIRDPMSMQVLAVGSTSEAANRNAIYLDQNTATPIATPRREKKNPQPAPVFGKRKIRL